MALFGVGLDSIIRRLNSDLKDYIIRKKGSVSVAVLRKIFITFDINGNQKLDIAEFEKGLASFGFFPKKVDLQALLKAFDSNGDGSIDFEEFLKGLQEPLTQRRLNMLNKVFEVYDVKGTGIIEVQAILAENHKVTKFFDSEEKKFKEAILKDFVEALKSFTQLTKEQFLSLHRELSFSVITDQTYVELLEDIWRIYETEGVSFSKEERERLIEEIKEKINEKKVKSGDPKFLRRFFDVCDVKKVGYLCMDELINMFNKLDLNVPLKYVPCIFKKIDSNNSCTIEFEEFEFFFS